MQRHIFGTLHPFFESGHINGRTIASAGFMTALLQRDPFAEYHFFVAQPDNLAAQLRSLPLKAVQRCAVRTLHRTALPYYLRHEAYALFHFSDPVSDYTALCQARNAWAPTIFPVTTVNHTISYSHYASAFLQHLWSGVSSRDCIGCNSHAAKVVMEKYFAHLQTSYGPEVCSHAPRLHVVPMGVDPSAFPPATTSPETLEQRRTMRQALGATDASLVLLLFGRIALADKMDPIPLMLAVKRAMTAKPDVEMRLVMAGFCGPEDTAPDYLRAVAAMLGIAFQIMPNPTEAEKQALYAAADIFVSPSDNIQETFGLSLLEAGAAHLPTVASDWNGYRDIIVHGSTGLLVPTLAPASSPELDILGPLLFENQHHLLRSQQSVVSVPGLAEALLRLAQNPALRASMGQAAHARIMQHFTWDKVVDAWLHLWETLRAQPLSPVEEQRLRGSNGITSSGACTRGMHSDGTSATKASQDTDSAQLPPRAAPQSPNTPPVHPALLPLGTIYAPYATSTPSPQMELRCTPMGEALRKGSVPLAAFTTLGEIVQEKVLLAILVWARKELSLEKLLARISNMPPDENSQAATISPEQGLFYVLWALKHDLLEVCTECHLSCPQPHNP